MVELVVPSLTQSDDGCVLVDWTVAAGSRVKSGEPVAILETAKASFDLASDGDGILECYAERGAWVRYGTVIGCVVEGSEHRPAPHSVPGGGPAPVPGLEGRQLSRNQEAVGRTVVLSHSTIPSSFTLAKVPCDRALALLRRFSSEKRILAGLGELVVAILARLTEDFPALYARPGAVGAPLDPNIGVTIDVGKGLFIPVVKQARSKDLRTICSELLEFRRRAFHNTFKAEDLMGADLSLSLNLAEGIVFAQPFIHPGQVCMLSLGGVQEEWDAQGAVVRVVHIGLSYDHRVANGQDAARFLGKLRDGLRSCEWIAG